jgi:peptidoglycan hydrolase CwlO-like protein
MVSKETGTSLHDRSTRGEHLSSEEQKQLEEWYAVQDRAEMEMLDLPSTAESLDLLQTQIDSTMVQVSTLAERIEQIAKENKALRREIATLQHLLAQQDSLLPA